MSVDINRRVLPGYGFSLGYTVFYLSVLVGIPIAAGFVKAASLPVSEFWAAVSTDRAIAAYELTVGASLVSALINLVIGALVAWVLTRYQFPLKRLLDSLIDLPFALPTAVAGLVYSSLYAPNGWLGRYLVPIGIQGAYSRLGIVLVLVFIGFPFVVRTLEPVIADLEADVEEAAACLGANRWQTVWRVIFPRLRPALITGFALSFARGLGEYGSVVFIAGNMPFKTEIAPVLVVARLEEYRYGEATAIAVVLLLISVVTLMLIGLFERWSVRHG